MAISVFILVCFISIRLSYQEDTIQCPVGSTFFNGTCIIQICPYSHVLVNNTCQPRATTISPPCIQNMCLDNQILINGMCVPKAPSLYCPNGGSLYNGMCYYNLSPGATNCVTSTTTRPPVSEETSSSTSSSSATTTLAPPTKPPCPSNSVLIDGTCRIIYCPKGTIYNGRCLEPVCSDGLVWTGRTCSKPEIITTILEIENSFISKVNQTGPEFNQPQVKNNIVYHTTNETSEEVTPCPPESVKCCTVYTPRICKHYSGNRWSCFHRLQKRCDEFCGNHSAVYLRVPKVIEQDSMLVVPPNPPLEPCSDDSCPTEGLDVDCSGCAQKIRETCSSYCYFYRCYTKRCRFTDQSEYCSKYPGSFGCKNVDGCFGEWCSSSDEER